jgi:quercetin dioxygenase-like cupin family protein
MKIFADASQEPAFVLPDGTQRRVLSYGGNLMLVEFRFAAGVTSALHSHPHEQVGFVISGEIDFIEQGKPPKRLVAGCSYYVSPNVMHNIVTYAPTVLIDCFTPVRDDFLT